VQKDYGRTIGGTGFRISNIEKACFDLLERSERRVRPRLNYRQICHE
jgi:hypothetical protein